LPAEQAFVAPISGAPRTRIWRMASAKSCIVATGTTRKSCDSQRWSMIARTCCSAFHHREL